LEGAVVLKLIVPFILTVGLLVSCGAKKDDKDDLGGVNCEGGCIQLPVLGKKLNIGDGLFQVSCNQYYFDYLTHCRSFPPHVFLDILGPGITNPII
jgi:hypothetical protein